MENKSEDLHILTVTGPDINNGTGFRLTIWVSGCTHHCGKCHNKHTWEFGQGHKLSDKYDSNHTYKEKIFDLVENLHVDGITVSGGDPLTQSNNALCQLHGFLEEFKSRYPNKTIWLYTGCIFENLTRNQLWVAKCCDIIVDGEYIDKLRDIKLPYRGSKNQRIIDVRDSLIANRVMPVSI